MLEREQPGASRPGRPLGREIGSVLNGSLDSLVGLSSQKARRVTRHLLEWACVGHYENEHQKDSEEEFRLPE